MKSIALAVLFLSGPISGALASADQDPIVRARQHYNQRQFDEALTAADEGRLLDGRSDSADLIAARALLERFRESAAADDLVQARERLRRINPDRLTTRERQEFVIGLGETLYLEENAGAAAGVFDAVLAGGESLAPGARERVLDWWASALDRDGRGKTEVERQAIYQRIRDRMLAEIGTNDASATASYWLSAAAHGLGDHQGAWDAAQAGWVRAPFASDQGAALRGDLDRLVQRAIIPVRARALAQSVDSLQLEWESFKGRWSR